MTLVHLLTGKMHDASEPQRLLSSDPSLISRDSFLLYLFISSSVFFRYANDPCYDVNTVMSSGLMGRDNAKWE